MQHVAPIVVRPWRKSDAPNMFAAVRASLAALCQWMPWCHPDYALSDAESWVSFAEKAWQQGTEYPLGVFDPAKDEVLGGTGINHINKAYRMGNLGYWVSTPHTGRGIARYAATQAMKIGFHDLGLTRLEIVALPQNIASQRVALALGAQQECMARNRLYLHGAPHDAFVYSLVPVSVAKDFT